MLAAPMPIISPFPSTSWPVRAANAEAVEIVDPAIADPATARRANALPQTEQVTGQVTGPPIPGMHPASRAATVSPAGLVSPGATGVNSGLKSRSTTGRSLADWTWTKKSSPRALKAAPPPVAPAADRSAVVPWTPVVWSQAR